MAEKHPPSKNVTSCGFPHLTMQNSESELTCVHLIWFILPIMIIACLYCVFLFRVPINKKLKKFFACEFCFIVSETNTEHNSANVSISENGVIPIGSRSPPPDYIQALRSSRSLADLEEEENEADVTGLTPPPNYAESATGRSISFDFITSSTPLTSPVRQDGGVIRSQSCYDFPPPTYDEVLEEDRRHSLDLDQIRVQTDQTAAPHSSMVHIAENENAMDIETGALVTRSVSQPTQLLESAL